MLGCLDASGSSLASEMMLAWEFSVAGAGLIRQWSEKRQQIMEAETQPELDSEQTIDLEQLLSKPPSKALEQGNLEFWTI
mmetsp:Transcript_130977/g.195171  ORF Transcript_130977/g.195171 Transcript_130977/m.195171 type:complete len:80 (+) Transcript_130977:275-514(+)